MSGLRQWRTKAVIPILSSLWAGAIVAFTIGCVQNERQLSKKPAPSGMVKIEAGTYQLGSNTGPEDERPAHSVTLSAYWIDKYEVTNKQFAEFVEATKYVTDAETAPDPKDFPDAPKEKLVPGALVFLEGKGWDYVPGASWRHPDGPKSTIADKMNHPVVGVSWNDANAYAKWAGKELPSEAQFEAAARGGLTANEYSWGDDPPTPKKANVWQGNFPDKNDNTDGYSRTSPVGSFEPNGYGLYDMAGNVWEWCADWYRPDAYLLTPSVDPKGPATSFDTAEPGASKRVVRGGSFLCADCYCKGYRVSARMKTTPDTGLCHTGFRCVINHAQ